MSVLKKRNECTIILASNRLSVLPSPLPLSIAGEKSMVKKGCSLLPFLVKLSGQGLPLPKTQQI